MTSNLDIKEAAILDKILAEIGNFGTRQVTIIFEICLILSLISSNHISFVFTAMDPEYRCFIPGCDKTDPTFQQNWLPNAIPIENNKLSKCEMFAIVENFTKNEECPADKFNEEITLRCSSFVFEDNANYLGREFNILCKENKWKLSLVGSINSAGMFFGLITSGFISDRYGRKFVLLGGTVTSGIVGIIKTFSPNYITFYILEWLDQFFAAGTYASGFILGAEMVTAENRKWIGCAFFIFYALGEVLVAVIAWIFKDWRLIIYTLYIPTIMTILFYWSIPESCRWFLSKGEIKKPIKILKKFAESNGKQIPNDLLKKIQSNNEENVEETTFGEMMKSRRLFIRFIICCFLWMSVSFVYYGLTINVVNLSGNSYMDFIYISLSEIPAYLMVNYSMEKIGRKRSLSGSYFIVAISCASFIFVEDDAKWLYVGVYCLAKFGSTAAFYLMYFVTSEIFPTPLRQTTMGICSTLARLGSLASPQIPLLDEYWKYWHVVLFSTVATLSGILSIFIPESVNLILPDTLKETELIGKKVSSTNDSSNTENP